MMTSLRNDRTSERIVQHRQGSSTEPLQNVVFLVGWDLVDVVAHRSVEIIEHVARGGDGGVFPPAMPHLHDPLEVVAMSTVSRIVTRLGGGSARDPRVVVEPNVDLLETVSEHVLASFAMLLELHRASVACSDESIKSRDSRHTRVV